jgi:Zn-dependent protease with chaperone function
MIVAAAAVLVAAAIALPHFLALDRTPPGFAGAIWLSALLLRALASLALAVAVEVYVPTTSVLDPLSRWCLEAEGTLLSGHGAIDLVLALPAMVLAGSVIVVIIRLSRAFSQVRSLVRDHAVGPGPSGSVIIAGGELMVAVAGLLRPRVMVSAGALVELDDDELYAALAHERGHIAMRHRYIVVASELARAVARFLPGTRAASRELLFSLERDADRFALQQSHDPAVLARVICKVALAARSFPAPALGLGGGVVVRRVRLLLHGAAPGVNIGLIALAPLMVALVAACAIALPFAAHRGYHESHQDLHHCSVHRL